MINSKPLRKGDNDAKELIIALRAGKLAYGVDIDTFFYTYTYGWVCIEFLKCVTVHPHESNPNRFWQQCFRKYVRLWEVHQRLGGRFYIIYYEKNDDGSYGEFKVHRVLGLHGDRGLDLVNLGIDTFEQLRVFYDALCEDTARAPDDPFAKVRDAVSYPVP